MSVTRKIELTKQIEEMRLLVSEQSSELPAKGRRAGVPGGITDERLERQRAILATLEWNKANEIDIRAWMASRKGQGDGHGTGTT